jgi:molybdopterin molybdotransferase
MDSRRYGGAGNSHVSQLEGNLIEINQAVSLVESHALSLQCEKVPLEELENRVLSEPILASRMQPPFDRVAMDGIALKYSTASWPLKIEGIQKAGSAPLNLKDSGNGFEVMTGATVPKGTDTVIPYELLTIENQKVTVSAEYKIAKGSNIHRRGSDCQENANLLRVGTTLGPAQIALIAGQGYPEATVFKNPKTAIISTGDELIEVGKQCTDWQIYRSNPYGIVSMLKGIGFSKKDFELFHLDDDQQSTMKLFEKILQDYELIILSGGVSMGKYDFVHTCMNDLGVEQIFHKVKQKPGKPLYFAKTNKGQLIFGLPGNPVSALTCMRRYVITSLKKSYKREEQKQMAVLEEDIVFKKEFTLLAPVKVSTDKDGVLKAQQVKTNGSGDFASFALSDGFLQLPADLSVYQKGFSYPFFSWDKR